MSATSISIRAMRWLSFVCIAPALAGVNNGLAMTIRGGQVGQPLFFGSRGIQTATDSLLIYLDGDQTTRTDDYYVPAQLTAAPAGLCPAVAPPAGQPGGPVAAQPGTVVSFNGGFIAGTNKANAIPLGAPVRGFERVTYSLYQPPGDPLWYIGFQPSGQVMQPLIGPLIANGLTFQYFDVNGNPTAVRSQVARIDVTVRARTTSAVRRGGQAAAAVIVDSVTTSVALRNNRRF